MKKAYRLFAAALAVMCLYCSSGAAFADVVWEPENNFYKFHKGSTKEDGGEYTVNSEKGYAAFADKPGGSAAEFYLTNGTEITIICTYEKGGRTYGMCESISELNRDVAGWVNMKDMVKLYRSREFKKEHASEINFREANQLKKSIVGDVCLYSYPLSGEILSRVKSDGKEEFGFIAIYEDKDGRTWGEKEYRGDESDGWVCLSDPLNDSLPDTLRPDNIIYEPKPVPSSGGTYIAIVLAVAAAAGAAAVISVYWKKKQG